MPADWHVFAGARVVVCTPASMDAGAAAGADAGAGSGPGPGVADARAESRDDMLARLACDAGDDCKCADVAAVVNRLGGDPLTRDLFACCAMCDVLVALLARPSAVVRKGAVRALVAFTDRGDPPPVLPKPPPGHVSGHGRAVYFGTAAVRDGVLAAAKAADDDAELHDLAGCRRIPIKPRNPILRGRLALVRDGSLGGCG